ncbi:RNA polymerase sigma factor [Filimonas effusa]|uniref:RNA polymerase sigma factor n=1 Tax=Filimonas effusa TaxID=2508721 RepID=UPI0013E98CF9|nr:RNA polymerase sigma-70 factor [Filimonas effusa]
MSIVYKNESDLLRAVSSGNEEAFAGLFTLYKDKVYAIALRMTESQMQAEDIVQDVFLRIWLRRDTLSELSHFKSYLYTATRNHVYNALKKIAMNDKLGEYLENSFHIEDILPDTKITEREYRRFLQQALDQLPERQRQVFILIKQQGQKREEAAALLKVSPETVKYHLAQANRSVRAFLISRFLGDSALMVAMVLIGTHGSR